MSGFVAGCRHAYANALRTQHVLLAYWTSLVVTPVAHEKCQVGFDRDPG